MIRVSFSLFPYFSFFIFFLLSYVIINFYKNDFIIIIYFILFSRKLFLFFHVPGCSVFRVLTPLVNCNKSSETYIPFGVLQGTILGPLLFLLYINDLPNCLMHSQPRMSADDTSITYASNDVEEIQHLFLLNKLLQVVLVRVLTWSCYMIGVILIFQSLCQ